MSWIAGDFFAASPVLAYPIAALAIQMTVFCSVALRMLFSDKETIDRMAHMPLQDQENQHG